ncbi:hypothetical protein D0Y65_051195, partial [Glycine soja]
HFSLSRGVWKAFQVFCFFPCLSLRWSLEVCIPKPFCFLFYLSISLSPVLSRAGALGGVAIRRLKMRRKAPH